MRESRNDRSPARSGLPDAVQPVNRLILGIDPRRQLVAGSWVALLSLLVALAALAVAIVALV
jgi:hypothetical protein